MKKKMIIIYSILAYIWSYAFWIISITNAVNSNFDLFLNESLVDAIFSKKLVGDIATFSVIAAIATLGPLFASIVISFLDKDIRIEMLSRLTIVKKASPYLKVIAIFIFTTIVPAIPLAFIGSINSIEISKLLIYTSCLFGIQLITSGAEEYGWRGFLLPELRKKYDGWNASFITGLIWAFWHLPIVIYIFYLQGMPPFAMVFSFAGFTIGSIAMSVVYTYFFEKNKSTLFAVYIHSIGNTIPFIASLIITDSYKVAIFSQLLIWVVVAVIVKNNKDLFPKSKKKNI